MAIKPVAIDKIESPDGDYEVHWQCEPPPKGAVYRTLEDEWNEDFTVRTIKRIES